jgi:hypothetical protein
MKPSLDYLLDDNLFTTAWSSVFTPLVSVESSSSDFALIVKYVCNIS